MRNLEPIRNQSQNRINVFLYGIICFLGGVLAFLYYGFYRSALLFFILNIILLASLKFLNVEIGQYPFILFGLGFLNCSYGLSLFNYLESNKHLPKDKEIIIGFTPIYNLFKNISFIFLALLISLYVYALLSLLGVKNDMFKNIVFCSLFFVSLLYMIWKSGRSK